MADELTIHWDNLSDLLASMREVGGQSRVLRNYFAHHVCDGSGFDYPACAMAPIGDQLPKLAAMFDDAHSLFVRRWRDLGQTIFDAAADIAETDQQVGAVMVSSIDAGVAPILGFFNIAEQGLLTPDPLQDELPEPEPGSPDLNHNDKFDAAADAWDTARDVINGGVDLLNRFGGGIPKLDERSLRDFVVYPLAANYRRIGANGNACGHFADGMELWGDNFIGLAGRVKHAVEGRTGTALMAQMDLYAVVMRAVGNAVRSGAVVYEGIARVSERIAVEVEDVLVVLGERLAKTSSRVASKFAPGLGWALLAKDLAEHGVGIVQDVIDDILECKRLIDDCFELVDEIKAWAEVQADRLHAFHQVLDLVQQLPGVSPGGPVEALNDGLRGAERSLEDIADAYDFGSPEGLAADALDTALEGLGASTPDSDDDGGDDAGGDLPEPDEDVVIMAPGPLGTPVTGSDQEATTA
jgi:hypothetical protein